MEGWILPGHEEKLRAAATLDCASLEGLAHVEAIQCAVSPRLDFQKPHSRMVKLDYSHLDGMEIPDGMMEGTEEGSARKSQPKSFLLRPSASQDSGQGCLSSSTARTGAHTAIFMDMW